jgi:hypothetical protein
MYKTIQESLREIESSIYESDEANQIIEDAGVRYTKYLKFANAELANKVRDIAAKRDGVALDVEDTCMYFPDEETFNHIWYHYKAKITPGNVTVEDLQPSVKESMENTYQVGRFTTTHTTAAFRHMCDHYGFTIERDPVGIGSRCYIALNAQGEKVGSFMDGVGTFYNDKLPKTTDEDFMAGAVAPEAAIVDESIAGQDLADRIDTFLGNYAKLAADYDPEYDDPDERWNGPDSAMMAMAANAIRSGQMPPVVHSDIGSGCYRDYFDPQVQAEHTAILSALDAMRKGQAIDEDVMVATPEKMVKLTPSQTQLGKGAEALRGALSMGGFSSSELRRCAAAVYSAMIGGMPSASVKSMAEGHTPSPTVFDEQKPVGATVYVFETDDMDPIVEECNLPPGRHVLVQSVSEDQEVDEARNSMADYRRSKGWAILPATMVLYGKRVVDIKTAASEWAPHDETILVCMKVDDERITFLASSGPSKNWMGELNTTHECFHDQTQASKGYYKVLNIVGFRDGEIVDKVNDIGLNVKASVAVFK